MSALAVARSAAATAVVAAAMSCAAPVAAPFDPAAIGEVGWVDVDPALQCRGQVPYVAEAARAHLTGTTRLLLRFDAQGKPLITEIAQRSGTTELSSQLDVAALVAARAQCTLRIPPGEAGDGGRRFAVGYHWGMYETGGGAPAAEAAASGRRVGGLDCLRPEYPPAAARAGVQGSTTIGLRRDDANRITGADLLRSAGMTPEHRLLDDAVLAAAARCIGAVDPGPPLPAGAQVRRIEYVWRLDGAPLVMPPPLADWDALVDRASAGDAAAQLRVAATLAQPAAWRDDRSATAWYRRAAEAGDADAQTFLGQRLLAGRGVAADDALAAGWLRKAAGQSNATAAFTLALMAQAGRGPDATPAAAVRWLERSATLGLADAFDELGVAHEHGDGVAKDRALAATYYCIAQRKGASRADEHLRPFDRAATDAACDAATRWLADAAAGRAPALPHD